MHLFQNKKKDVKQFLEEMKANKTNRSSNKSPLNFVQKKSVRPVNYQSNFNDEQSNSTRRPYQISSKLSNGNIQSSYHSPRPIKNNSSYQSQNYYPQEYIPQPMTRTYTKDNRLNNNMNSQQQFKPQYQQETYNSHQIYPNQYQSKRNEYSRSISQNSNSTIYEPIPFYQNYDHQKSSTISNKYHHDINNIKSHKIPQIQQKRSIPNFQKPSFYNYSSQNSPYQNKNEYQNSNLRFFSSQATVSMEQIRQVEQGLSTQNDSPGKITQFFSKPKIPAQQIQQIQIQISNYPQNKKSVFQTIFGADQQDYKTQLIEKKQNKHQFNKNPDNYHQQIKHQTKSATKNNTQQNQRLKISQKQKRILKQKIPKIDKVKIRINDIMNEVSILLQNIKRSQTLIQYDITNPQGKYYKYLNQQKFNKNNKILSEQKIYYNNQSENNMNKINKNQKTYKKVGRKPKNKQIQQKRNKLNFQETINKKYYYQQDDQIII